MTCRSIHVTVEGGVRVAHRCERIHADPNRVRAHRCGDVGWAAAPRTHWTRTYHDPHNPWPSYWRREGVLRRPETP